MVRRHAVAIHLALMAFDALTSMALFVVVSAAVSMLWLGGADWHVAWHHAGVDPIVGSALYAGAWVGTLWVQNLYRLRARTSLRVEVVDVARSVLFLAIATFAGLFLLKLPEVSRVFLIALFAAQFMFTVAARVALRWLITRLRRSGRGSRFVLIVGTGPVAAELTSVLRRQIELGLSVMGYIRVAGETPASRLSGPVLGSTEDVERILHERVVDELALCLPLQALPLLQPLAALGAEEGKVVRILRPPAGLLISGGRPETLEGIPVLSLVYGPDRAIMLLFKRIVDVVLAGTALVLLAPMFGLIALAIVAIDGRPILFRQTRVGLHGRLFTMVKFRSMIPDAEERLDELMERNELKGQVFKLTDDPRSTRTGRWLRRTSLDELPQLWNVLRGEMSIVGPRPPLVREVAAYDLWQRRRLSMKPGLTGLWQVSARREADFDRWVRLDLDYIERWSLWLDFKIMARTIPAMLQGR